MVSVGTRAAVQLLSVSLPQLGQHHHAAQPDISPLPPPGPGHLLPPHLLVLPGTPLLPGQQEKRGGLQCEDLIRAVLVL